MASLLSISIKGKDGKYTNYTIAINDETNQYGQNCSMYKEQTKEQRDAKEKKEYIGNGKVFWTDGKITTATKKDELSSMPTTPTYTDDGSGLPF
jgi:hypothetical protein